MSKADPIFSKSDAPSSLPPELQGKSAEEIAAYYQRREQIFENRLRQQPPPQKPAEEKKSEKFDMFGDPEGSVRRVVTSEVNEQVSRVQQIAQPAIVASCRIATSANHPADWAKYAAEVERRMMAMDAPSQMNPEFWELTYKIVKGESTDRLVAEAEERGRKSTLPIERPTPPGDKPPAPRELSQEEKTFARKFGMTEEEWRKNAERYEATDGALPLTMDSRQPPRKREQAG